MYIYIFRVNPKRPAVVRQHHIYHDDMCGIDTRQFRLYFVIGDSAHADLPPLSLGSADGIAG